ncbi:MAG TPA: EAL domain-containing protein [Nocardioidaceae bacterium]|nr:EAL domain-containing protein [Nocardioidaceae bacterium]
MRFKRALMGTAKPSEAQTTSDPSAWEADGEAPTDLKAELSRATELGQFELVYQPIIDIAGAEVLGWEALVRWQHPARGAVPPAEFIPAAEGTGDILPIGQWVLNRACEDFSQTLGRTGRSDRWVSVNISTRQVLQPDFADTVRRELRRWGLEPGSLVLEVTEAALVNVTESAPGTLASLRRDGVRVALDNWGLASSSLEHLPHLPVDILKIDRFLVSGSGEARPGMLDTIVALGRRLGLDMIAEGIEESAELERVEQFADVAAQGFYIARPMPVTQAGAFSLGSGALR